MAVTTRILATYRAPRRVMRGLLDQGERDGWALACLMVACGLIFVSRIPPILRDKTLRELAEQGRIPAPADAVVVPADASMAGTFFAWVMIAPLLMYGIAALSHLVARLIGGRGSWFGARLALFWTLLAVSPLMLLNGLVEGYFGQGPELALTGGAVLLAFGVLWLLSLWESERPPAVAGQSEDPL